MNATEQASRPAPRLEQGNEETAGTVSAPAMAALRLRGVLDAAMREALTVGHLVELADRLTIDAATVDDLALLDAFDAADLTTANMSAAGFIIGHAAPFRAVAAVMLRPARAARVVETITRAAAVVGSVTEMLRERLQVLPDADELLCIGARFEYGDVTPADIALIRALPGPHLRANASARHYASVFVDYRLWDY